MRELADYHSLTSLWYNDINEHTHIRDEIEKTDFKSHEKEQAKNFNNFIDFLNKNKLKHIYSNEVNPTKVPLDEKLKAIDLLPPIGPVSGISMEEMVARWEKYYPLLEDAEKRKRNRSEEHTSE